MSKLHLKKQGRLKLKKSFKTVKMILSYICFTNLNRKAKQIVWRESIVIRSLGSIKKDLMDKHCYLLILKVHNILDAIMVQALKHLNLSSKLD